MIVMKFGGSSVKDAERFKQVSSIIKNRLDKKPIVVLSAVKGTTDNLISSIDEAINDKFDSYKAIVSKHKKILKDLELEDDLLNKELEELKETLDVIKNTKENSKLMLDYVCFFGERMSVKILSKYLCSQEIKAESFISGDIGLLTNSNFGDAAILEKSYELMNKSLSKLSLLPVVTGFGGKDEKGEYTTFNRGGSDYVAALIGAAVKAESIEIWTDVSGIMTADPRIVENVKYIPELSFDEASELSYFGAKVLHPKTIWPAIKNEIPVYVLNTFEPEHPGSKIVRESSSKDTVAAFTYKGGITVINAKSTRMLNAHGYLAKIFEVFEKYKKPVDMISTSEVSVSMTVDSDNDIDSIINDLKDIAYITIHKNKSIIYVVGQNMPSQIGIAAKIFNIISESNINVEMISSCSDGISIGFIIDEAKAHDAVKALHKAFAELD